MRFSPPITHVYNPLEYARQSYRLYIDRYGSSPKEAIFLGMNPGPWGMVQTGIPFGEVGIVRDWLRIEAPVGRPAREHPRRPVLGFACRRSEVSGRRLWGWARRKYDAPGAFFRRFLILNYCPLAFFEETGRNRTPDHLAAGERDALYDLCDAALRREVDALGPRFVVGIGRFAEQRARIALAGYPLSVAGVPHPSPANPAANRGWERLFEEALDRAGIKT